MRANYRREAYHYVCWHSLDKNYLEELLKLTKKENKREVKKYDKS